MLPPTAARPLPNGPARRAAFPQRPAGTGPFRVLPPSARTAMLPASTKPAARNAGDLLKRPRPSALAAVGEGHQRCGWTGDAARAAAVERKDLPVREVAHERRGHLRGSCRAVAEEDGR